MSDLSSKLVVVSGPSGAGKDTIVSRLLGMDSDFSLSVSATTRAPRGAEVDGKNYYFLSTEDFLSKIENDAFIEYAKYGSNYYGTLKSDVEQRIRNGKTVILVIEVNGAANIKRLYPGALSIFIMPPSSEVLENRLRKRQTDSEDAIIKRLDIAKTEISRSTDYDYIVINDDLDRAVAEAHEIIKRTQK
ncbi:MAG: guanylate kinase [Clostridia bacterium]|nr:guanylate kinase [Clostridia bacterium]